MPRYVKCEKPYELVLPDGSKVMVGVEISVFSEFTKGGEILKHYNVENIEVRN